MASPADPQQQRLLEALRQAADQPVSFSELHAAGISFTATIGELELDGYVFERVYQHGHLVGVRLLDKDRVDRSLFPPRRRRRRRRRPWRRAQPPTETGRAGGQRRREWPLPCGRQRRITGDGACDDWPLQSEGDVMRLNVSLPGNIIGGLIAAVIFFVIDVATGGNVVAAIGLAVILGIVVVAISFVISRTIIASKRKRS